MIEKIGPTIYNGESIYNTGAGGGGGVVTGGFEFGGIVYPFTKIGDLYWTTQNLIYKDANIAYTGTVSNTVKQYTRQGGNSDRPSGTFGYYYNQLAADYINGLLTDGWRIPNKTDIQNLLVEIQNHGKKILSPLYGGNGDTTFNLYSFGRIYISNTIDFGNVAYLFSRTIENTRFQGIQISSDSDTISTGTALIDGGAVLFRLCKDA